MGQEFEVLHSLRVKGLAKPEVLRGLSGIPVDTLESVCQSLADQGFVMIRGGAMPGYMLTPAGKAEAERLLKQDEATEEARDALVAFDERFLPFNTDFKKICHRWQMKGDDEANDHTDAEYDAAVIAELAAFHTSFQPELATVGEALPRFSRYEGRLADALQRVQDGDAGAFARPLYDSYHDIWMELHNDVVLSIGRERGASDEQTH